MNKEALQLEIPPQNSLVIGDQGEWAIGFDNKIALTTGKHQLEDGTTIDVVKMSLLDKVPFSKVAFHEACHAFVAAKRNIGIEWVTIVPGVGYNGAVKTKKGDAEVAMAAHSMDCDGTGHDRKIASFMTRNIAGAASRARGLIMAGMSAVKELASTIQYYGTIGEREVNQAIDRDENPTYQFDVTNPDGDKRHLVAKIRKGAGLPRLQFGWPRLRGRKKESKENESRVEQDLDKKADRPLTDKLRDDFTISTPNISEMEPASRYTSGMEYSSSR
jgi:hypothetical protein